MLDMDLQKIGKKIENAEAMISDLQCFTLLLWPLFMDGVQLPQSYRATMRKQFTYYQ